MSAPARDRKDVARVLRWWFASWTSDGAQARRVGKLLAEMGLVPHSFPYDNLVSQGLERQLARV